MKLTEIKAFKGKQSHSIGDLVELLKPDLYFKVPSAKVIVEITVNQEIKQDKDKKEDVIDRINASENILNDCFSKGVIVDNKGKKIDLEGKSSYDLLTKNQLEELSNALYPLLFPDSKKKT